MLSLASLAEGHLVFPNERSWTSNSKLFLSNPSHTEERGRTSRFRQAFSIPVQLYGPAA